MESPTPLVDDPETAPPSKFASRFKSKFFSKKTEAKQTMVVGCGNKCIKYFFWLLNFLFFVLGGVICGLALWMRFDQQWQQRIQGLIQINISTINFDQFYWLLYIVAAFGLILFILGGLGCCGSCCESICVIGIYFTLVGILFVLEIAGGVYLVINKDNIRNNLANVWRTELVANYQSNSVIRDTLDNIQRQMSCCGATGCSDYQSIPQSCTTCFSGNTYAVQGCAYALFDTFTSNMVIVLVIAIAILVVEFIALVFACCTCCAVKSKRNTI